MVFSGVSSLGIPNVLIERIEEPCFVLGFVPLLFADAFRLVGEVSVLIVLGTCTKSIPTGVCRPIFPSAAPGLAL